MIPGSVTPMMMYSQQTVPFANVLLLNHMDATNTDVKGNSLTTSGFSLSTDQSKFGTQSLRGDPTIDTISAQSATSNTFEISGNFTMEAEAYFTDSEQYVLFWLQALSGNFQYSFQLDAAGTYTLEYRDTGGTWHTTSGSGLGISLNQFNHLRVVNVGGLITAYVQGEAKASNNFGAITPAYPASAQFNFESYSGSAGGDAYYNELRFCNVAACTSNFAPPSQPWPNS